MLSKKNRQSMEGGDHEPGAPDSQGQPDNPDAPDPQDIASTSKSEDAPEPQGETYPGVRLEGTNVSKSSSRHEYTDPEARDKHESDTPHKMGGPVAASEPAGYFQNGNPQ
jgi:hypothetical protein